MILLGLDNSGKTTLLANLNGGRVVISISSFKFYALEYVLQNQLKVKLQVLASPMLL